MAKKNDDDNDRASFDEEKILNARFEVVKRLNETFRMERYVYIGLSSLSFIIVCTVGWRLFDREAVSNGLLLAFLGPTGFIAVAITRILFMWSTSIKLILKG